MADFLRGLGIFITGSFGVWCLIFAYQIWTGDTAQYERNRQRIKRGERVSDFDLVVSLTRPWRPWP